MLIQIKDTVKYFPSVAKQESALFFEFDQKAGLYSGMYLGVRAVKGEHQNARSPATSPLTLTQHHVAALSMHYPLYFCCSKALSRCVTHKILATAQPCPDMWRSVLENCRVGFGWGKKPGGNSKHCDVVLPETQRSPKTDKIPLCLNALCCSDLWHAIEEQLPESADTPRRCMSTDRGRGTEEVDELEAVGETHRQDAFMASGITYHSQQPENVKMSQLQNRNSCRPLGGGFLGRWLPCIAPTANATATATATPPHRYINTPTHQHTNTPTHQHTNTPTHRHTEETHRHTDTDTGMHNQKSTVSLRA
eukprot:3858219-Rhodomonas_salina.1